MHALVVALPFNFHPALTDTARAATAAPEGPDMPVASFSVPP